jgi:hypothetical protein
VDVAVMVWSNYCVKTWRSQAVIRAWEKYYSDEAQGRATAYEQSLAWNRANPGKQKCFSYGPLTSPDGGTTSGGVCANPVTAEEVAEATPAEQEAVTDTVDTTTVTSSDSVVRNAAPEQASESETVLIESEDSFPTITVRLLASLPRG